MYDLPRALCRVVKSDKLTRQLLTRNCTCYSPCPLYTTDADGEADRIPGS
jgi:hypothetical protein